MRNLLLLLTMFIFSSVQSQDINIIPKPKSLEVNVGSFTINQKTPIVVKNAVNMASAVFLRDYLKAYYGFNLKIKKSGSTGIILNTNEKAAAKDGYSLISNKKASIITGETNTGTFYGVQTLIQLFPVQKSKVLNIPAVTVNDAPDRTYRGLHLDVGRHFMPISFIKKYIDLIALHKMNYFHWHLTEDQGWRIEIKKYPKLTSVGGWRNGTIIGPYPGTGTDGIKTGGFYTQEEVKDIVAYAAKRFIEVIPEIEMPGHASAAIAAYPYLSCFPDESTFIDKNTAWSGPREGKQVQQTWGVFDDVFCAGKESTFTFLEDVLNEVIPLFPSKYFHVGADECPKKHWQRCPNCQKRIKELGIKSDKNHQAEHYLQSYVIKRMEKFLNGKGKSLIGWDEILEGGLAPNAIVMSWRGEEGGIAAAKEKHRVIMTPNGYAYFDHQQEKHDDSVTISNNRWFLPIEKVYSWSIVPTSLKDDEKQYIWGGQANLWTEYMKTPFKVEYMLFPRAAALSEVLWTTPAERDYKDFQKRLSTQLKRYDLWDVNYYKKNK
jgi:hexosaminidase